MVQQSPIFIPSCVPLGVFLIHFNRLSGLRKIPDLGLDLHLLPRSLVVLTF